MIVAASARFIVIFEAVAPEEELANVASRVVVQNEFATRVLINEVGDVNNKVVEKYKFPPQFDCLVEA